MREGTYGKCAFCDSSIPLARLQALPYAMSCIQCQRELEKRGLDVNSPIDWEAMTRDGILGGDASILGNLIRVGRMERFWLGMFYKSYDLFLNKIA